jgi:hypothetical protein
MSWNKTDIAMWLMVLFLVAIIFGLYQAEGHKIPPSLFDRTKVNSNQLSTTTEHFETSSNYDVSGGASTNYGYKYTETEKPKRRPYRDDYERKLLRGEILPNQVPQRRCKRDDPNDTVDCYQDDDRLRDESCRRCDILMNDDLPKYVLKSSVPPMPDMSEYIKKSQIPACRKSDVNLDDYIHKSKLPKDASCDQSARSAKTDLGECPKCPDCPSIPDDLKTSKIVKNISEFKIVSTEDIENLLQDERVKAYLDQKYDCKKPATSSIIADLSKKIFPEKEKETTVPEAPATEEERVRPTMQIVKKKKKVEEAPVPSAPAPSTEPNLLKGLWNSFLSLFGVKETYENTSTPSLPKKKQGSISTTTTTSFSDVPFLSPPSYNSPQRMQMIYNSYQP